jgi:hypothetical protein
MDIIPVSLGPFCYINTEDGVVLADARLRAHLAQGLPDLWNRVQARRAFMRDVLGINLDEHLAVISQAARVWANAHNGRLPSDFVIMSNELVIPRLLVCPGDKSRQPADNWQSFTSANSS